MDQGTTLSIAMTRIVCLQSQHYIEECL